MRAIVWLSVAGCFPVGGGVQVGEEDVAVDMPCLFEDREVALDEGVFDDGSSAGSLLGALVSSAVVAPSWNDGGDATLAVDLEWDGGPIVFRTAEPKRPGESCPAPSVDVGLVGTAVSSDGALDEALAAPVFGLAPGGGGSVDVKLPEDRIGGSIDPHALLDDAFDGPFTASLEVLVHLSPGEVPHGALVALGCPTQEVEPGLPTPPCEPVEHDVAVW